jgi:hypothetical protein
MIIEDRTIYHNLWTKAYSVKVGIKWCNKEEEATESGNGGKQVVMCDEEGGIIRHN